MVDLDFWKNKKISCFLTFSDMLLLRVCVCVYVSSIFIGSDVDWISWFFFSWIIKTWPLTSSWIFLDTAAESCKRQRNIASSSDDKQCFQDNIGGAFNDIESGKESAIEMANSCLRIACDTHSEGINPVLREVAEWEIPWEDLRIGERIGIGKIFFILICSIS